MSEQGRGEARADAKVARRRRAVLRVDGAVIALEFPWVDED